MTPIVFKQGEDKKVSVIVTDTPTVDFTTAIKIVAAIIDSNGNELKRYDNLGTTGYGVLEVDGTDTNQINIFVERADSVDFPVGVSKVYLSAELPDVAFPDEGATKSWEFKNAVRVTKGEILDEPIP